MLKQQFMVLLLAAAGVEAQRPGFGNRTGPPAWVTSIWSSRISAIQNQQPTQQPQQTQQQQPSSTQIPRPGQTQAVWGQCGGKTWTGTTTCARDTRCVLTNEYYSQCLPEEEIDAAGRPVLDDPYVVTQVITTVFQVPTAGVVTTFITILTPAPIPMPVVPDVPDVPEVVVPITAVPDTPITPKQRRRV